MHQAQVWEHLGARSLEEEGGKEGGGGGGALVELQLAAQSGAATSQPPPPHFFLLLFTLLLAFVGTREGWRRGEKERELQPEGQGESGDTYLGQGAHGESTPGPSLGSQGQSHEARSLCLFLVPFSEGAGPGSDFTAT